MLKPIGNEASLINQGRLVNIGQRMPIDLNQFGREDEQPSFSSLLKQALDHVNDLQQDSSNRMRAIETGASTDLVGTVIAAQKASLSFQALMQVRNKVVSAYEEIMRMQI